MPWRFASSGTVASSRSASRAILALNVASNFLRDLVIAVLHGLRHSRTLHTLTSGPISGGHFNTGVHQKPGAGGQPLGANEFVALIGHLQVANKCRIASAILTAASSGPIPKAPGSAGGYLPSTVGRDSIRS